MYAPPAFREDREDILLDAIAAIRFAALVTAGPNGIEVTHVPTSIRRDGGAVWIETHVARGNPHWQALGTGAASVAIFQGPQAYITPAWYPSKQEHGKVVPTWAYIAVHAHGVLRPMADDAGLRAHLGRMTDANEAGRPAPWAVSDAPDDYIAARARAIVGLELRVERLEGSWKLNQNKTDSDREGTREGLLSAGPEGAALAAALAQRTARGG